jgi:hypothetical protein
MPNEIAHPTAIDEPELVRCRTLIVPYVRRHAPVIVRALDSAPGAEPSRTAPLVWLVRSLARALARALAGAHAGANA